MATYVIAISDSGKHYTYTFSNPELREIDDLSEFCNSLNIGNGDIITPLSRPVTMQGRRLFPVKNSLLFILAEESRRQKESKTA